MTASCGSDVAPSDGTGARSLRFALALLSITALALIWSVTFTLLTKGDDENLLDEGDAFYYGLTAANAANGNWFQEPFSLEPAADHPPLTVVVLTPTSYLFDGALAQRLTMCVFGALTVAGIGLLGREVGGDGVGLIAAALAAVNANLWINHALVMSEAVSGLLITALLYVGYRLLRTPTLLWSGVAGVLVGLSTLARAELALLFAFMVAPILLRAPLSWTSRAARLGLAALLTVVVLTPWMAWVNTQFERPVVVSTNEGLTLAGANCDDTYFQANVGFWSIDCAVALLEPDLDASENSAELRRDAISYAREHASRIPTVLVAREGRMLGYWRPDMVAEAGQAEGRPVWASWLGYATFWVLLPLAVAGAVMLRRRRVPLLPLGAMVATTVLVALVFYGIPRQRLGLDIVTSVLAAVAIGDLMRGRFRRGLRSAPAEAATQESP